MALKYIAVFNYGGGMRGLIPATIMAEIERKTGLYMSDMVDMFTGPSTGAILNAALTRPHRRHPGRPQYKASHMVRFYEREGASIFPNDKFRAFRGFLHDFNNRTMRLGRLSKLFRHGHYASSNLAVALYKLYGEAKLSDARASLVIPFYNIVGETLDQIEAHADLSAADVGGAMLDGGRSVWMKNLIGSSKYARQHVTMDVKLYDLVMASTAAPTFFKCHDFQAFDKERKQWRNYHAIDGSIFDNPCMTYHGVIQRQVPEDKELLMISLGTGFTQRSIHKDEWNSFGSMGVVDPMNDLPLINIFFHASESALMESFSHDLSGNLYSFNKALPASKDKNAVPSQQIDNATPENIAALKQFARDIIEENQDKLDQLCHIMVKNYEDKQKTKGSVVNTIKRGIGAFKNAE